VARLGVGVVALAMAGLGIRSLYSEISANSALDNLASAVLTPANDAGLAAATPPAKTPQSRTIGFAPIGATDRVTLPDRFEAAAASPPAGPAANPAARHLDQAQAAPAAEEAAIDRTPAKLEGKPHVAKKKPPRSVASVYELPDGRQVTVRHPVRNAYGYAEGAGFDPWNNGARSTRRDRWERPVPFASPF
jgi:hypothetical protein